VEQLTQEEIDAILNPPLHPNTIKRYGYMAKSLWKKTLAGTATPEDRERLATLENKIGRKASTLPRRGRPRTNE
jgi:hypothetical protein